MKPYYEQDGVTIYHGDSREIVPLLAMEFDAVIADPPYQQTSLAWDSWPTGWPTFAALVSRSLWCFGSLRMFLNYRDEFKDWRLSQDLVWEKHNGSNSSDDRFRRVHEQVCHFYHGEWESLYTDTPKTNDATARVVRRKKRPAHWGEIGEHSYKSVDGGPRQMRSVMFAPSTHGHAENETEKPEVIVAPLVQYACPRGGILLSMFCGSGTDLVVARKLGRRVVGIDLREDQCEKSANRVSRLLPMEVA